MAKILLAALVIMLLALVLLGIRILLVKGGKFPSTHIEANKALRDKGIHCANRQMEDEARRKGLIDRIQEE